MIGKQRSQRRLAPAMMRHGTDEACIPEHLELPHHHPLSLKIDAPARLEVKDSKRQICTIEGSHRETRRGHFGGRRVYESILLGYDLGPTRVDHVKPSWGGHILRHRRKLSTCGNTLRTQTLECTRTRISSFVLRECDGR